MQNNIFSNADADFNVDADADINEWSSETTVTTKFSYRKLGLSIIIRIFLAF